MSQLCNAQDVRRTYAAAALSGLIAKFGVCRSNLDAISGAAARDVEHLATIAFDIAEAMVREEGKRNA